LATSSQDGAPGAGTHAQAEAMGLGPAAVVRLERALAHEVSPLLHSHTWICAEGGAGTRSNDAVTGMQANRPQAYKSGRQHRPRPTVREWAGQGQTRQPGRSRRHQTRRKRPMVNPCGRPSQATRRGTRIFLRIDDEFSDPSRLGSRRRLVLTSCSPHVSAGYAQSVDNCVEGRHTMLTRRADQSDGIGAT
jgi:hypothetical protein